MNLLYLAPMSFFLVAIMLLGFGITGMVLSESCCFPPNCAPENVCDAARAPQTEASGVQFMLGGVFLVISAFTARFAATASFK